MPKISPEPKFPPLVKMILLGISGTGKSTSVVPLSIPEIIPGWPGLELRVLDFDGKFEEVFRTQLRARLDKNKARRFNMTPISQEQYDAAFNNLDLLVCREATKIVDEGRNKKVGATDAAAWQRALKQLKEWGPSFAPSNLLLVDSLTYMAAAISNYTQALGGKLNQNLSWRDYLAPQQEVQAAMTYFGDCPAHVIITGHQGAVDIKKKTGEFRELPNGTKEEVEEVVDSHLLPMAVGSAGRISLPAQLNHMLVLDQDEKGGRQLYIKPKVGVVTKSPYFALAEASYGIDKGLVEYFKLGM
jgi:hypothetical protein